MFKNLRSPLVAMVAFAIGLGLSAGPAHAAKGQWSLGGNFGVGLYSNGQLNDSLEAVGLEKVSDGFEYGGTLRYGIAPTKALELETNLLNGESSTDVTGGTIKIKTKAVALPLNLLFQVSENDKYSFHFLIGAGPMLDTKITAEAGSLKTESESKTAFMAQGGFEGDWFMSKQFALTARALGRYAKASDIELDKTDPSAGKIDVNLSGAAFSLGLRVFFGGP